MFKKVVFDGEILGVGEVSSGGNISEEEYNVLVDLLISKPAALDGYDYRLRDDTLEWELVELPPVPEPEPTADEALTRYANELTGKNDPDLVSATETLITKFTEE